MYCVSIVGSGESVGSADDDCSGVGVDEGEGTTIGEYMLGGGGDS